MSKLAKARLTCFKDKENEQYDYSISKLASKATEYLIDAYKILKQMKYFPSASAAYHKLNLNLQMALAATIREHSRALRHQQKYYFTTIRAYEHTTANTAIQLTQSYRYIMLEQQYGIQYQHHDVQNQKIADLVASINSLSTIYKYLNQLVIEEGSLIDRIDVSIEATYEHTKNAVVALEKANEAASSAFADKMIKALVITILVLAVLLGAKYAR